MTIPTPSGTPRAGDEVDVEAPDVSDIVIDDGAPVDNMLSEKQMRLLTEPLYTCWEGPPPRDQEQKRAFLVAANVGLFATPHDPPLVPDTFLSLDVEAHPDLWKEKRHRTYFFWEFGKPPDVVIEVVSNRQGGELGAKKRGYARMRILFYAVWDPMGMLGEPGLHAFELRGDLYVPLRTPWFEAAGLGLTEWHGFFENMDGDWLRWCRQDGTVIPTGAERAETAEARAETAEARAERLAARLRELGVEPDG
jgi:Uma2 family endonuclease